MALVERTGFNFCRTLDGSKTSDEEVDARAVRAVQCRKANEAPKYLVFGRHFALLKSNLQAVSEYCWSNSDVGVSGRQASRSMSPGEEEVGRTVLA